MADPSSHAAWGTGPGVITPDGCAVDLYAQLPGGRDAEIVAAALRPAAQVLDLGAGTGRITHELAQRGHSVVAVDESPEMLAHIRDATTIQSPIADLDLPQQFDAVLLASHLVNTPSQQNRLNLLRACRRHCADDGAVLLQRHTRAWVESVQPSRHESEGIIVELQDVCRGQDAKLSATVRYTIGTRVWTHHFTVQGLDDTALAAALETAGLRMGGVLSDDGAWVWAVPAAAHTAGKTT